MVEAIGFITTLEKAKKRGDTVKLMFQYPGAVKATKKSGTVLDIDNTSFTINELYDGVSTYSYNYLVEVNIPQDQEQERGEKVDTRNSLNVTSNGTGEASLGKSRPALSNHIQSGKEVKHSKRSKLLNTNNPFLHPSSQTDNIQDNKNGGKGDGFLH